jgi:SAM-dependent methyltransferase
MADKPVSWRIFALTLLEPWYMMYLTCTFLPSTVRDIIQRGDSSKLLDWRAFKNAWFAAVWAIFGPMFAHGGSPMVGPLMAKATGVVLDIGPGAGDWVHLFNFEKNGKTEITKIYGIEPNTALHAGLREKVKKAGLEDVYEIVAAGAQELGNSELGIERGSIDTIITVQSICSVPRPKVLVKELYEYLKPGGTWIMWEHVRTHETGWIRWYQGM